MPSVKLKFLKLLMHRQSLNKKTKQNKYSFQEKIQYLESNSPETDVGCIVLHEWKCAWRMFLFLFLFFNPMRKGYDVQTILYQKS